MQDTSTKRTHLVVCLRTALYLTDSVTDEKSDLYLTYTVCVYYFNHETYVWNLDGTDSSSSSCPFAHITSAERTHLVVRLDGSQS